MAKIDRAKLKKLLKELDGEKVRAVGKKVKGAGVVARAKVGAVVEEQKRIRTPEVRAEQARERATQLETRRGREAVLGVERRAELEKLREAKEAETQRRRVEHEIFEEKYGKQIRKAKALGRGVAAGTVVLGKGLAEVGKLAAGTETIEETKQRVGRVVETGKRRGFVAEPLRAIARERQTAIRARRREDIASYLESEGVTRTEARRARQTGDMFDFPGIDMGEIDLGF